MAGIGVTELLIVLGIILLIFGPKRLPMLGRQLGGGMREFKDSITGKSDDADSEETVAGKPSSSTDADGGRAAAASALGRSPDEAPVVDGEVVAERDR